MIQINDISINPQADELTIDAEIIIDAAFNQCYIKKIYIDTQDSYLTSGPSEDAVYVHDVTEDDVKPDVSGATVEVFGETKVRKMKLVIPQIDILANLTNNLFVVYIEADCVISDKNTNFCETDYMEVGCVFYMRPLYTSFLAWIKEIANSCEIPKHYIYAYLQYQALLVCIRTGNMLEAIKIYNKYIKNLQSVGGQFKGCGCRR